MVKITIGAIPPVQDNPNNGNNPRRQAPSKKLVKDRRKNKRDRRRSVRTGVTVTLSTHKGPFSGSKDRRKRPDRRRVKA